MSESTRRILIVDDEVNILRSLERLLEEEDYEVHCASNAQDGLYILETVEVGVVLSDQRMPEETGIEFLRKVKTRYPDPVRIILSGYSEMQTILDAVNQGAIYKFITKPWDDENLIRCIDEAYRFYELNELNNNLNEVLKEKNKELQQLNEHLSSLVDEKVETLKTQVKSLKVYQEVIEHFPLPILGLDPHMVVVLENRMAIKKFSKGELSSLGHRIKDSLKDEIVRSITSENEKGISCADSDGNSSEGNVYSYRMGSCSDSLGYLVVGKNT